MHGPHSPGPIRTRLCGPCIAAIAGYSTSSNLVLYNTIIQYKKGDVDNTNNYRGIALINILAKPYSKLLHDHLMKWASENEKIMYNQFGFQKKVYCRLYIYISFVNI